MRTSTEPTQPRDSPSSRMTPERSRVTLEHTFRRERFDIDALDPDDPFEIDDDDLPHLAKQAPFTAEDALDAWAFGDSLFYPAAEDGSAD